MSLSKVAAVEKNVYGGKIGNFNVSVETETALGEATPRFASLSASKEDGTSMYVSYNNATKNFSASGFIDIEDVETTAPEFFKEIIAAVR
jgi:hypothetical protein